MICPVFDHYAIFVRDLARSTEFYAQVMGFEQIAEPFHDGRHVWFRIGDGLQVHLVTPPHNDIPPNDDVHFAFRVPSVKDFIAKLESLNIPYGDQRPDRQVRMRPDGIPQIYFQDPDGYWIEVNEAIPAASPEFMENVEDLPVQERWLWDSSLPGPPR